MIHDHFLIICYGGTSVRPSYLTHLQGVGECALEHDPPPGSDVIDEIMRGPMAAERMEFEIADGLAHHFDAFH